jgi:flagellar FliL protein
MSKEATTEEAGPRGKPPKKGMMVKILACLGLLGAGGGAAYGLMLRGMIGESMQSKDDNKPKFVMKGEEDPYAPPSDGHTAENVGEEVEGVGGSPYRTSYYSFGDEFTSNLRTSGHFVQLSLAASTNYDGRVLMWLKKHELAIRSAILIVLADTSEEEAYTVQGKARLQKRLTAAVNQVLIQNEGFGGVKDVLFKSYIVQ